MDNNNTNNNTATGTAAEGTAKETQAGTATGTENNAAEGTVTMSKVDYDKAIQAAEDRVRTKYSKDIKALEKKVAELTPVQKTEASSPSNSVSRNWSARSRRPTQRPRRLA